MTNTTTAAMIAFVARVAGMTAYYDADRQLVAEVHPVTFNHTWRATHQHVTVGQYATREGAEHALLDTLGVSALTVAPFPPEHMTPTQLAAAL